MKNNVLFISEKTIKEYSTIMDNVDGNYLQTAIREAQDSALEPTIGTNLLEELSQHIIENSLNEHEKYLLDYYIKPFLIYSVLANIIIPISYKLRNAGAVQNYDQQSTAASMNEQHYLMQYYANKANYYENRLFNYLVDNHNDFKEFCKCKRYSDIHSSKTGGYKTNIYLKK